MTLLHDKRSEVFLLLAFCFAGAFVHSVTRNVSPDRIKTILDSGQIASGEPVEIEGYLTAKPESGVDGYFLDLRAEKIVHDSIEQTLRSVKLFTSIQNDRMASDYAEMDLRYGTRMRVACVLEREERFQDRRDLAKQILISRDDATAVIKAVVDRGSRPRIRVYSLAWTYDLRQDLISFLEQILVLQRLAF